MERGAKQIHRAHCTLQLEIQVAAELLGREGETTANLVKAAEFPPQGKESCPSTASEWQSLMVSRKFCGSAGKVRQKGRWMDPGHPGTESTQCQVLTRC